VTNLLIHCWDTVGPDCRVFIAGLITIGCVGCMAATVGGVIYGTQISQAQRTLEIKNESYRLDLEERRLQLEERKHATQNK